MSEIFNVSTNPHVRSGNTTQTIMRDVLIALTPASIFGIVNFGLDALLRIVIGVSGIIAIVMCMFFPLLRIGLLAVIYQGIAAGLQPISDKRMVRAVSSLGQALGMIVYIMMITLVLFILTIAIICVATNCVSV